MRNLECRHLCNSALKCIKCNLYDTVFYQAFKATESKHWKICWREKVEFRKKGLKSLPINSSSLLLFNQFVDSHFLNISSDTGEVTTSPEIYFWKSKESLSFFTSEGPLILLPPLSPARSLKRTYMCYPWKTKIHGRTQPCTKCS